MLTATEISSLPASLTGQEWYMREADERLAMALSQRCGLPDILARIMAARGVDIDAAEHFLNPTLKEFMPDPSHLKDMDAAAERVASAVMQGERVAVFGDYDVDGATSSALLLRFLRAVEGHATAYIPDRMSEGYGPNTPALLSLKKQGASVVITVDCGTLAFEPLAAAHEAGLDVIVIDHHMGEARLPKALAVVNPNRADEDSPHRQMAAVGVAFLLAVAVNRKLREMGWYAKRAEPDLRQLLDLVALGTVCDVVPLTGVNRAYVKQGLKIMAARGNLGLRTVFDLAQIDAVPSVYHAGFVVGPRINAGGRVGKSDLGVRLLSTEDPAEALGLAKELEQHNEERKAIEAMVLEQAMAQAEMQPEDAPLLAISSEGWHAGVIGIVAGRIKERFHKPVAVIAFKDGIGKASARSVTGFDFGAAVIAARDSGLLLAGGGHAMAAGFTVEADKLAALAAFLSSRAVSQLGTESRRRRLVFDGMVHPGGATVELADTLERLGPFGQGNPNIRLMLPRVTNIAPGWVGADKQHIKTLFGDPLSNARLPGIAFRAAGTALGDALLTTRGKTIAVAGQLKLQEWQGKRSVSFHIEDVALSS